MKKHVYFLLFILLSLVLMAGCGSSGGGNGGGDKHPPSTTTDSATSITTTSAELKGSVNPNGLSTECWFKYGESSSALTNSTTKDSISGSSSHSHTDTISGLQPATTYYYQLIASNSDGTDEGEIKSFATSSQVGPIDPTINSYSILGYGTDVFGQFASSENKLAQVLDIDMLNQDYLLDLDTNVQEAEFQTMSGKTINEFASSFGASVGFEGEYKFFSGSITASFSKDHYKSTEYSFVTIMDRIWKQSLKIKREYWNAYDLRVYLTENARDAIQNDTPEDLFESYGTHVMVGIYSGARLDYNLSIKITDEENKEHLETFAKIAYNNGLSSGSFSASMETGKEEAMSEYSREQSTSVKGGTVQLAGECGYGEDCQGMYRDWLDSIDDNPVWCGYMKDSLIPVWEFAEDEARRDEIEAYYREYAEGKESAYSQPKITDIKLINNGNSENIDAGTLGDYVLLQNINGDTKKGFINSALWHGTKYPDHIYIAIKTTTDIKQQGIENIHIAADIADNEQRADELNAELFDNDLTDDSPVTHDDLYGSDDIKLDVDLNSGTCADVTWINDNHTGALCDDWTTHRATCVENDHELYMHYVPETPEGSPITCIVLANKIGIDSQNEDRINNIYWAPADANSDGKVDVKDAEYVLHKDRINWVVRESDIKSVNLNWNTKFYELYDQRGDTFWECDGYGYDDKREHALDADPQYLGYCLD